MPSVTNRETGEIIEMTNEELATQRERAIAAWHSMLPAVETAKQVIAREQALRKEVASLFFLSPEEGVNTYELQQGWKLKLTYKIDRKIDEAALGAVKEQLAQIGVSIDPLLSYKPSLVTKAYKGLQQVNADAAHIFDQALVIKPASPTIELVEPKTK